jgi:hypothetical protein
MDKISIWSESGPPSLVSGAITILFAIGLINGVRGAYGYHNFRGSILQKKEFGALNLTALLYAVASTGGVIALQIAMIPKAIRAEYDSLLFTLTVCVFLLAYAAALFKFLPFTRRWNVVVYRKDGTHASDTIDPVQEGTSPIREEIDSLLRRGVVFSVVWAAGVGSLIALRNGLKAKRMIREAGFTDIGTGRVWWCILVGAFGTAVWLPFFVLVFWTTFQ